MVIDQHLIPVKSLEFGEEVLDDFVRQIPTGFSVYCLCYFGVRSAKACEVLNKYADKF